MMFCDGIDHDFRFHELTCLDLGQYAQSMFEKDTNFARVKLVYLDFVNNLY